MRHQLGLTDTAEASLNIAMLRDAFLWVCVRLKLVDDGADVVRQHFLDERIDDPVVDGNA